MSNFSSTIKISSISDYITPSQECVKPLMKLGKLDLQQDFKNKPDLIKNQKNVAKVSLQDCLACSGCVTTAETILIETHSIQEFQNKLKISQSPAILISSQSRASLAFKFGYSDSQTHYIIQIYFQKLGVVVYDQSYYQALSLKSAQEEFNQHLQGGKLPLLCSECPGWVCYAEKTLDEAIINHMSKIKSPQQIFGKLMRHKHDFISVIMPCFDKKLEAVRQENEGEIDLVLSTREVEEMIESFIQQENYTQIQQLDPLQTISIQNQDYHNPTSNNYLDYIIQQYTSTLNVPFQITQKQRKNNDFIEIFITQGDQIIAQFARVYGLKNIANLNLQIKSKTCKYLYVEIMACPMGCLNGGGQLKYQTKDKDLTLLELKKLITQDKQLIDIQQVQSIQYLTTTFKHIPKESIVW
ncbi:hypothetical protein pb186bvf_011011 [Paramecium bursaria]